MNFNFSFKKISFCKIFLFIFIFLFSGVNFTSAASLSLSPSFNSYEVGDNIRVRVVLSTSGQSVNAIAGNIKFSTANLTLNSITKTGSIVSLWAVEPTFSNSTGVVNFEGVVLNGYSGSNGTVLTLNFRAKSEGTASLSYNSASVYANDGLGTSALKSSSGVNFPIRAVKPATPTPAPTPVAPKPKAEVAPVVDVAKKVMPSIDIQELDKTDKMQPYSTFAVSSIGQKPKTFYTVSIDGVEYPWSNQDSGVFRTPSLERGEHTITISMETVNENILSTSVRFSVVNILAPVITGHSESLKEGEYIVIKGISDPNVDIRLDFSLTSDGKLDSSLSNVTVKSDFNGMFTFVSEKVLPGAYSVTAWSVMKSGVESEKSKPIIISVSANMTRIVWDLINTFSALIPIIAVVLLIVVFAIWGWYKVLSYKHRSEEKFSSIKNKINSSFDVLDKEMDEQLKILKKVKALESLSSSDRAFIKQFKKDLRLAEKAIVEEAKKESK
jgi:hypothetical protein